MSVKDFVQEHGMSMTATRVDNNPNMDDMPAGSTHWKCVLHFDNRQMTVPYSMGSAHSNDPEIEDVLECLASDASTLEYCLNREPSFEEWAYDLGYDTDSRKAERTYKAIKQQAKELRRLLENEYDALLYADSESDYSEDGRIANQDMFGNDLNKTDSFGTPRSD